MTLTDARLIRTLSVPAKLSHVCACGATVGYPDVAEHRCDFMPADPDERACECGRYRGCPCAMWRRDGLDEAEMEMLP